MIQDNQLDEGPNEPEIIADDTPTHEGSGYPHPDDEQTPQPGQDLPEGVTTAVVTPPGATGAAPTNPPGRVPVKGARQDPAKKDSLYGPDVVVK